MTEKKKIDLKKQEFKWGAEGSSLESNTSSSEQDASLSTLVESVNQKPSDIDLSPIAKDRKEQRGNIDSAVDMIPTSVKEMVSEKTGVAKNREDIQKSYTSALDDASIHSPLSRKESPWPEGSTLYLNQDNELTPNRPETLGETLKDEAPKVKKEKKLSSSNTNNDVEKFKGNVKDLWKPILGIAILLVAIVVGVTYKDPRGKESSHPVQPQSSVSRAVSQEGNQGNVNQTNKVPNTVDVVSAQEDIQIPVMGFNKDGEKKDELNSGVLSLNSVLPGKNSKGFTNISLAQWPNAISLEEVPSNQENITRLFPEHLFKKLENFQESLVIYDKRSAEQEKFVRQSQSCYYLPKENNGNWMGVNYYMISYCFLNSQFIGFNLYTNSGPDVMKKVEASVSKYPYLHISSVQKLNGFNIINVEQNQAYKILEDYRIQLLSNILSKK